MERKAHITPFGNIAYWTTNERFSTGPTLVFLPGLTADHRLFDKQIEYFKRDYNCLVWDAPAHLESRPFSLGFTLEDWARWLHEILDKEGVRKPVLIGQSMGGYLSQMFMDMYPGVACGFVSVDSGPLQRQYFAKWELFLLKHTRLMYLSIPWKPLITWGSLGAAQSSYGRKLMRQMMESYEKVEYCNLTARGYLILAEAVESGRSFTIDCPVQLICGTKDQAGSCKRYSRQWAAQTGFPLEWIEGAGHNSNTDEPQLVNQVIQRFVKSL